MKERKLSLGVRAQHAGSLSGGVPAETDGGVNTFTRHYGVSVSHGTEEKNGWHLMSLTPPPPDPRR